MDFISLAQGSHTIVRYLTEVSSGSGAVGGGNNEDDDFADLENISHDHDRLVVPSSSSSSSPYGALSPDESSPYTSSSYTASSSSQFINTSRPLLSPTAESELLSLSTNFLLYTAMVVIVTLVAQIYFPSCLEPREPIGAARGGGGGNNARRMDSVREEEGFDFEDDDDEEEEDVEGRRIGAGHLDSVVEEVDDDDDEDEVSGLLINRSSTSTPSSPVGPRAGSRLFMRDDRNNSSSFLNELMDENKKKSRESVYTNLAICAIMLNLTFVSWGLLQVRNEMLFWKCKSTTSSFPF